MIDVRPSPRELAAAVRSSLGLEASDMVMINASIIDVWRGEIVEGVEIAVKGRIISCVGRCSRSRGSSTKIVDLRGSIVAPGFIDAHTHIESTFLRPSEFSKAVISRGTTAVFADPHEIANVAGFEGLRYMAGELSRTPLKAFLLIPPNVPASLRAPGVGGALLRYDEVIDKMDLFSGVGEVMDIGSLLDGDERFIEYASRLSMAGIIQGHAAVLRGEDLDAYASLAIGNDHEVTEWGELIERLSKGIIPIVRYGSSWRDLERLYKAIQEYSPLIPVATDDIHALHIAREGHLDRAVRRAIELGVDPVKAIASVTLAPAILYGMQRWIGSIAPGRYADLVVMEDLERVRIKDVYIDGDLVASNYRYIAPSQGDPNDIPGSVSNTVKIVWPPKISLEIQRNCREALVRVIKPIHGTTLTKEERRVIPCGGDVVKEVSDSKLLYVTSINRYGVSSSYTALLEGIELDGAIASTVSHDSHNIIAVGSSLGDIMTAVKAIVGSGGGISLASRGRVEALVELGIAGLMSRKGYLEVVGDLEKMFRALEERGFERPEGILLEIQLLSLTVIPEIRITDRGLYLVSRREVADLVISYN
ncbi:MAG: adenine deaminase C-terminal domain-containing protein [Sulfolobales archaeon]